MKKLLSIGILFLTLNCLASESSHTIIDDTVSSKAKDIITSYLFSDYMNKTQELDNQMNEIHTYLLERFTKKEKDNHKFLITRENCLDKDVVMYRLYGRGSCSIPYFGPIFVKAQDEQSALSSMMAEATADNRPDVASFLLQNSKLFKDSPSK